MMQPKKVNYYYIDESGNISNDSKIFIHGCIKTDSPTTISETLVALKEEMASDIYYEDFKDKILKKGFHATENSMDMRKELYRLLPLLNYRAYFVIVNKESDFFKEKLAQGDESDFFAYSLKKLLDERIISNKEDKNIFLFETIQLRKKSLARVLEDLFEPYKKDYDIEYKIVGKEEENMAIVDYLNFIFNHLLTEENPIPRMKQNLKLVAPKIALINMMNKNVFLSRKKSDLFKVTLENIETNF